MRSPSAGRGRPSERLLLVTAVDLDHAAVDVVVELRAPLDEPSHAAAMLSNVSCRLETG